MPQLSLSQRQLLEELHKQQLSKAAIASRLGVHASTIKRELERNMQDGRYEAVSAHEKAKTRKQKAGAENRKKREFIYLSLNKLLQWQTNFCVTLKGRDPDAPVIGYPYQKRREKRFRLYSHYHEVRRPKRIRKRRFRRWRYRSWKKWYDRSIRKRDHILENIRRTPRSAQDFFMLRNPLKSKKRRLSNRDRIRQVNRILERRQKQKEKQLPLNRLASRSNYRYPSPILRFFSAAIGELILRLHEKFESFYKQELRFHAVPIRSG
jgi:IS30 family transposase